MKELQAQKAQEEKDRLEAQAIAAISNQKGDTFDLNEK